MTASASGPATITSALGRSARPAVTRDSSANRRCGRYPSRPAPRDTAATAGTGLTPGPCPGRLPPSDQPDHRNGQGNSAGSQGPGFLNSYGAGANPALGVRTLGGLRSLLRCESGGKGVTAAQAEVGVLCEALERHCGMYHGDEARISGSYRSLRAHAVHSDTCQLHHPRQYADRGSWNPVHSPFQHVVAPFDDDAELDWTPVWPMTRKCHRLLPTAMLYYHSPNARLPSCGLQWRGRGKQSGRRDSARHA